MEQNLSHVHTGDVKITFERSTKIKNLCVLTMSSKEEPGKSTITVAILNLEELKSLIEAAEEMLAMI